MGYGARCLGVIVCLAAPSAARAQLAPVGAPPGALRFEVDGAFDSWDKRFRDGHKEGLAADLLRPAGQRPSAHPRPLRRHCPARHRARRLSTQSRRPHRRRAGRRQRPPSSASPSASPGPSPSSAGCRSPAREYRPTRPRRRERQRRPQSRHGRPGPLLHRVRRGAEHAGSADRRRRLRWRPRPPRPRRRDAGPGRRALRRPVHPARRSRHRVAVHPHRRKRCRHRARRAHRHAPGHARHRPRRRRFLHRGPRCRPRPRPPTMSNRSSAIPSGPIGIRTGESEVTFRGDAEAGVAVTIADRWDRRRAPGRFPRRGGGTGPIPLRRPRPDRSPARRRHRRRADRRRDPGRRGPRRRQRRSPAGGRVQPPARRRRDRAGGPAQPAIPRREAC